MKRLLLILFPLVLALGASAANPPYEAFLGTNGIIVRSNPPQGKILIDGAFITNGGSPVFVTTNLFVVNNAYISNIFVTNLNVNQTLVTSNLFVTNLFVTTQLVQTVTITSNLFVNTTVTTNLFVVNNTITSNLFVTNLTVQNINVTSNLFVTNLYATNIFVEQVFSSNFFTTNIFVEQTLLSSTVITTNLFVNQIIVVSNTYVTNLFAGTIISKDILWTNDNGTVRLIDQSRVGLGTNGTDGMFLIERSTNAINFINATTNGVVVFQVASNGNLSVIQSVAYTWPSAQGAAGTALTNNGAGVLGWGTVAAAGSGGGTNFDSIRITNQVLYVAENFNGSNGASAVILTNNLDAHLSTWKRMTNVVGTNLVFHLSNLVESSSFIQTFFGNAGYTNTVSYRIPGGGTGTNLWWYGETNGAYDFQVSPGQAVTVNGFVDSQTNIVLAWSTTANLPKLNLFAINGWISNLFTTNILALNASISNLVATNIFVKVGGGASNAGVGGTYAVNSTPIMTAGTAETNLLTHSIAAHSLTNLHDRLLIRASGRFAANGNNKQIKLVYGTTTILDTTAQAANAGGWTINAEIIRTGNATETASAEYHGTAESLFTTASAISMAEDNGIANIIKITGTTPTASGDITNRTLTVEFRRASP